MFMDEYIKIDCIKSETNMSFKNIKVQDRKRMFDSLDEPQECQVIITVSSNEFEVIERSKYFTVLDYNSWTPSDALVKLLPFYIERNVYIDDNLASKCLIDNNSLSNKLQFDIRNLQQKQESLLLARAAYMALQDLNLSLRQNDQPFLDGIHSVKWYSDLVRTRVGSIADIVILYSGLLQQLGLSNSVAISTETMWVVICMDDTNDTTKFLDRYSPIYRRSVLPIDVAGVCAGSSIDFWSAITRGCRRHYDQRESSVRWIIEVEAQEEAEKHWSSSKDSVASQTTGLSETIGSSGVSKSNLLSEYYSYEGKAGDDPLHANVNNVGRGLRGIVDCEGPILDTRAFELYVKGLGLQRLDHERHSALNKALRDEIDSGRILVTQEGEINEETRRILRSPQVAPIFPRERGSRSLRHIPIQEIQFIARLLMLDVHLELSWCSEAHLRLVAEVYDLIDQFAVLEPVLKSMLDSDFPY